MMMQFLAILNKITNFRKDMISGFLKIIDAN